MEINRRSVAENKMNSRELFQKVKELNLPLGRYALFGSAPMAAKDLRDCRDIDIIVTADIWNEFKGKKKWEAVRSGNGAWHLASDDLELWKDWGPGQWNVEELIREAEIIDGLPFVKLEMVLAWKKLNAREKDLKDAKAIEKFLKANER